jgi:hypothetical protein
LHLPSAPVSRPRGGVLELLLSDKPLPTERPHETAIEACPDDNLAIVPLTQVVCGRAAVESAARTSAQAFLDNSVHDNRDFGAAKSLPLLFLTLTCRHDLDPGFWLGVAPTLSERRRLLHSENSKDDMCCSLMPTEIRGRIRSGTQFAHSVLR